MFGKWPHEFRELPYEEKIRLHLYRGAKLIRQRDQQEAELAAMEKAQRESERRQKLHKTAPRARRRRK